MVRAYLHGQITIQQRTESNPFAVILGTHNWKGMIRD
jgi:hypothetical protein